jgi:hypothetical protein
MPICAHVGGSILAAPRGSISTIGGHDHATELGLCHDLRHVATVAGFGHRLPDDGAHPAGEVPMLRDAGAGAGAGAVAGRLE